MGKKKLVAAYCRVSTLEQKKKGYGIDIQKRDIEKYAENQGLLVDSFYLDEAKSGVSERRTALNKLVRNCKSGEVGTIIVSSLDRLSRDLRFTENLLHDLNEVGVTVFIADMPNYDGNDRKDVLIRQIKEAIAEENRKEIIERLKKGREERARKGCIAGGTLPYGYMRQGKEIKKNPKEVEIVKAIYSLSRQHKIDSEIADRLNGRGYYRRNGKYWTQRQVSAILSRENLYRKGVVKYGEISGENAGVIII
ncbi:MAG TPA: recombinase family protein [Smithella sp.]|nr:recombinase family protein [Smithella sp.]